MEVIQYPLVRIFTTLLLSLLIISPWIQNIYEYSDTTTIILYFYIAVYILAKKIYDVIQDTRRITHKS